MSDTIKKAITYIIVAVILILAFVYAGIWIPKAGFMPDKIELAVSDLTIDGERGLNIGNPRIFILSEVVIDLNGSPWSAGYTTRIISLNAKSNENWISISDFAKDGVAFPPDGVIERVEIYGIAHGQKFYSKIPAAKIGH